jgi:hypothetical protein
MTNYSQCSSIPTPVSAPDPSNILFQEGMVHSPSDLTINTSFLGLDDWRSSCPSPLSSASSISTPGTPSSYMNSPCPEYATYTLNSLEHSLAKSFGNEFLGYSSTCDSTFSGEYTDAGSPPLYHSFEPCPPKYHMANSDLDFSAFMPTLPEYSL